MQTLKKHRLAHKQIQAHTLIRYRTMSERSKRLVTWSSTKRTSATRAVDVSHKQVRNQRQVREVSRKGRTVAHSPMLVLTNVRPLPNLSIVDGAVSLSDNTKSLVYSRGSNAGAYMHYAQLSVTLNRAPLSEDTRSSPSAHPTDPAARLCCTAIGQTKSLKSSKVVF